MILIRELRTTTSILAVLLASLALPGVATAGSGDPCTAAAGAGLKITDPTGGGAHYATHELAVTARGTGADTDLNQFSAAAPGAQRVDDPESSDPVSFVRDTPGPLTFTGVVDTTDPSRPASDPGCSANIAATVQLLPALVPRFSLRRPKKGRDGRGDRIYEPNPRFVLTVKHRTGTDHTPFTVRARVTRRLRLPKKGAKVHSEVLPQRASDTPEQGDSRGRGCKELVCAPRTKQGGHLKGPGISASLIEGKVFHKGLRVELESPNGYPPPFRRGRAQRNIKTPYGADIQVFQSGKRIARLRVVANCDGYGQSAKCRFRKISTKR